MLIIGAKGFAKEVLEVCIETGESRDIAFYDDVNPYSKKLVYEKYPILKTTKEAKLYFKNNDARFTLGLGNPVLRFNLYKKFTELDGIVSSTISTKANIGHHGLEIDQGCNILSGSIISNDVIIGKCCIVYFNTIITHDCIIGDYVELSPAATILGRVRIGNFCQIGAGSTILPNLTLGTNVIVGAGAVVTKNIPDNSLVIGVPAKIIKELQPVKLW